MSAEFDPWFKGPEVAESGDLHRDLLEAMYAPHPAIRQSAHWVMDLDWYKRIRAFAYSRADPDRDDPDKWTPHPDDCLFGIHVEVTDDGGAPHLENRGYQAGWPAP